MHLFLPAETVNHDLMPWLPLPSVHAEEPRGIAFVEFNNGYDAEDAKRHMDRTMIGGREVRKYEGGTAALLPLQDP